VQMPQISQTFGPDWHFFGHPYNDPSYNPTSHGNSGYSEGAYNNSSFNSESSNRSYGANNAGPQLAVRRIRPAQGTPRLEEVPQVQYASYVTGSSASSTYTQIGAGAPSVVATSVVSPSSHFAGTSPGVPVFVLKTGTVLAVGNYTYQDGRISYELASGGSGVIGADEVDWTTTTQMNLQRGVRVSLPSGHASIGAGL
jgi:hypothetical protein